MISFRTAFQIRNPLVHAVANAQLSRSSRIAVIGATLPFDPDARRRGLKTTVDPTEFHTLKDPAKQHARRSFLRRVLKWSAVAAGVFAAGYFGYDYYRAPNKTAYVRRRRIQLQAIQRFLTAVR